jgi:hypothetical protein
MHACYLSAPIPLTHDYLSSWLVPWMGDRIASGSQPPQTVLLDMAWIASALLRMGHAPPVGGTCKSTSTDSRGIGWTARRLQEGPRLASFVAWALPRAGGVRELTVRFTNHHQSMKFQVLCFSTVCHTSTSCHN